MRRHEVRLKRQKVRAQVAPDDALLARLKAWRTAQARSQSVPPYVVFHDATLAAIAAARPRDLVALAGISGIGQRKLERYGPALIDLLQLE